MNRTRRARKCGILMAALWLRCLLLCAQGAPAVITDIEAYAAEANTIVISWMLPSSLRQSLAALRLYRNSEPILRAEALEELEPIAVLPPNSISYNDSVDDSRRYYYAVISVMAEDADARALQAEGLYYDEELDAAPPQQGGTALALVLPGVNATINGVQARPQPSTPAPAAPQQTERRRGQPLPTLDILGTKREEEARKAASSRQAISEDAERQALTLLSPASPRTDSPQLAPYLFSEDSVSPSGGDDYLLFEVLQSSFVTQRYQQAGVELETFLAQNRSRSTTQRALFYLGQSYYFCGKYRQALGMFLQVEDAYPSLSRKWIDGCLDRYEAQD